MSTFFDTDSMKRSDRPDFWQKLVCDTFVRLECSLSTPEDFNGRLETFDFGEISLVNIRSSGQRVTRHRHSISNIDEEFFLVSFADKGPGRVIQNGREVFLKQGDFTIYDTRQPYTLQFDDVFEQTVVQIPRRHLSCRLSNVEHLTAIAMSRNDPLESMVFEYFSGLKSLDDKLTSEQKSRLASQGLDLLAMSLSERGKGHVPPASRRTAFLYRIKDYIQQNLGDNELNIAQLSSYFGVSSRYINSLFQEERTSFGRYLLAARLQHCASDLRNSPLNLIRISDIAFRWGFNDMAYFSRVFRARYGLSPREFRRCESQK